MTAGVVDGLSLDRMRSLVGVLGDPQTAYPVIHLTGTNGKGSTARMLEAILRGHGLSVGLYTSPHLEALNERLVWDGRPIGDEELAEVFAELASLEPLVDGEPTWFELVTAAAFAWFAQQAVDVAVVEVGLLGRYDATNVADGLVAVVTNVGQDHTDGARRLARGHRRGEGRDRQARLHARAGRGRPGAAGDLRGRGPRADLAPGPGLRRREQPGGRRRAGSSTCARRPGVLEDVFLPVHGAHQGENLALAVAAAEAFFDRPLDRGGGRRSPWPSLKIPGRFEIMGREPLVVLDGAHNPDGVAALTTTLHDDFADVTSTIVVLGMLAGRDPDAMIEALELTAYDVVICTTRPSPRALPAAEVAEAVARAGLEVEVVPDVAEAFERAKAMATSEDRIIVTGSLYVVGAARSSLCLSVAEADEGGVLVGEDLLAVLVGERVAEGDDAGVGSALRRAAVDDLVHVGEHVAGADGGVVGQVGHPETGDRGGGVLALHAEGHVHGEDVDGGGDQAAERRGGRGLGVGVEGLGVEASAELEDLLLGDQVGGLGRRRRADLEVLVVPQRPLHQTGRQRTRAVFTPEKTGSSRWLRSMAEKRGDARRPGGSSTGARSVTVASWVEQVAGPRRACG